jgi:hypothetical protein
VNRFESKDGQFWLNGQPQIIQAGHPVTLPARRGAILPLEWQPMPGVVIHYLTSEVIALSDDGARLTLKTEQAE